ncbi:MAG TPA: DUF4332 domain-containing protein [Thiothrix sp.]|nr:DUF4332 domain-containing protein [Thiothrix sp.]
MDYLLSQIWMCLGLIALIAGLAGWFLRGGSKNKIKAIEEEWKVKLARAQNERDYYAGEVKNLNAMAENRESVEKNYQNEKQALAIRLEDMQMDAKMTSEAFNDQERLLKQQALELEESRRALSAKHDIEHRFEQKLIDYAEDLEKSALALRTAEEKISDLQTELDSTKIQLLDTTDKLAITEGLLVDGQNVVAKERQTILPMEDKENSQRPSPAPIQKKGEVTQTKGILGTGSLLSMPTSSVEIVDAHDERPVKTTGQALDDAFSEIDMGVQIAKENVSQKSDVNKSNIDKNTDDSIDYKSATLAGAGAAALGMAGKMKDKLTQVKDDLLDKVDLSGDVYTIQDIHIINSEEGKHLSQMNIISTEDMIDKCSSQEGVERIAKSMGKENWVVRSWVSMADLMRVQGVDTVNAELLELSGISSVQALASAKLSKLTESIKIIHKHVGKTNHVPDSEEIEGWIKSAANLPKRLDDNLDKL